MAKFIDGIKVSHNARDWTGHKIGRITVTRLIGKSPSHRSLMWEFNCSCGKTSQVSSRELAVDDTKSCGCLKKEVLAAINKTFSEKYTTHGMSGTVEQKAWKRLKSRCLNPNSEEYEVYSKIGISDSFSESFMNFYNDIGPAPIDSGRMSVDRIDNTKGYIEGNVRWATDTQQARNKGMYTNNKSGVNGVYLYKSAYNKFSWAANYYTAEHKQKTRYFNIEKLGEELAFFAACEFRSLMIERLNLMGAGYTENHGK